MAEMIGADPNIFFQQKPFDPGTALVQGMKLGDMMQESKIKKQAYADDQATRKAFSQNMVTGADGTKTIDAGGVMSDLADAGSLNPRTVQTVNQVSLQQLQQRQAMINNQMKAHDTIGQLLGGIDPKASPDVQQSQYSSALDTASKIGIPGVNQMPKQYDASLVDAYRNSSLSTKDQLSKQAKLVDQRIAQQNADAKTLSAQAAKQNAGLKIDQRNETIHGQNLKAINNDPTVTGLVTTANNLQNAITNFQKGGATPQEFNELQQAVRSNAGIKGAGGVSERDETYLKSLGLSKDKVQQFLTGDPKSVLESDPAFAKQILGIANLEIANKQKQANQAVDQLAQGHKSFYAKPQNADRARDFNSTVSAAKSRISVPAVQMKDPRGNIRMIPANQVDAAKAAGGKEL